MSVARPLSMCLVTLTMLAVACGGAAAPTATPTRPAVAATQATAVATPTSVAAQSSPTPLPRATAVPTPAPTPTRTVAKTRGRVVIASSTYADFEPDITRFRSGNTRPLVLNINDTLVGRNEEGKWYGLLAESWTAAPDKWTFKVKKGVKFHDGTTMKASDIKFTLDRQLVEPFYVYRGELSASIARVEAPDDTTLIIHTKQPYPVWLYRAEVGSAALPADYYTRVGQAEYAKKPIGVGAFKFVSRELGQRTVLTAFEDYHLGAPQVKDLVLLPIPEPSTKMAMLKAGEADMIDNVTGAQSMELKGNPNFRLVVSRYADTLALKFNDFIDNDPSKPTMNIKVRQAVAYAIDRQALVDRVYFGNAEPAGGNYNPIMIGFNPNLKPYPYDVAKAKQLMKEAGYANGFEIENSIGVGDQTLALAIQGYLRDIGITVKLTIVETAQFSTLLAQKKFRGYIFAQSTPLAFADAEQVLWLYWLKIGTWGMWQDDKIMAMYDRIHVETDLATRSKLLQESDAYMYEQLPMVNLVHRHAIFAVNKKIDFKPTPGNYNVDPSRRITWMAGY